MSQIIAELPNYLPTQAQRRWLVDLLDGKVPVCFANGIQWFGGTKAGLIRRGLINESMELTDVGRKLAQAIKDQNEPGNIQREYFRGSKSTCASERHEPAQPIGGLLPTPVPSPRLDREHVPAPKRVKPANVLESASSRPVPEPAERVDVAGRGEGRRGRGRTTDQFVTIKALAREAKRVQISKLKKRIKKRLAATMDIAERQSLRHELQLADLRLELLAAKEDPGDL